MRLVSIYKQRGSPMTAQLNKRKQMQLLKDKNILRLLFDPTVETSYVMYVAITPANAVISIRV